MIVAGTGHRPDKLAGRLDVVEEAVARFLEEVNPDRVISGMALGFDQILASQAARLGMAGRSEGCDLRFFTDGMRHLVCLPYSRENLHRMGEILGIKRCWFHSGDHPHYDIPKRRIAEIEARCEMVTGREILAITKGERG